MNKKIIKIILVTFFLILILCNSINKTYALGVDPDRERSEIEIIYLRQNDILKRVHLGLIIIQLILIIVHIWKVPKGKKIKVLILSSYFGLGFSFEMNSYGGLGSAVENPVYPVYRCAIICFIHLFCIIRSSKLKKEVGQNNKEGTKRRIDFFKDHVL